MARQHDDRLSRYVPEVLSHATARSESRQLIADMGLDEQEFAQALVGEEALDRIRTDVRQADEAGLRFTPMIFINGVAIVGGRGPQPEGDY